MPLIINDYSWRQTEDLVFIRVPLKGISHNKVNLFTSDVFIKVHFPPYLFEACLFETINEEASKCTLSASEAIFELKKIKRIEWPSLHIELTKKEQLNIKKSAIDKSHQKAIDEKKIKSDFANWRNRQSISHQLAIETKERQKVDEIKKVEKDKELKEIETWKETNGYNNLNILNKKHHSSTTDVEQRSIVSNKTAAGKKHLVEQKMQVKVPAPRKQTVIKVKFTPRAFPTPCRESKLQEEQEWLKKQVEARRLTGFVAEDLHPEENDPQWLLDKGQSFYKVGNYLGAVSAYTHAIGLCDKIPDLYVARSSAQLSLGNYRRVVNDTTRALELMRPHVESNQSIRFVSHYNRGQALYKLGLIRASESDLEEALNLMPDHNECRQLLYKVELTEENTEELPSHSYIGSEDLE